MKRYTIVVESSQGSNGGKKGSGSASTTENDSASESGLKMQ
jgi:hypothetical protein